MTSGNFKTLKKLYDTDFVCWSEQMGQLMRDRKFD
jgi:hypothetical protein